MSTTLATQQGAALVEQVVIHGDLSKLTPADRIFYYRQLCESAGLNPLSKPFEYLHLNGKLRLYALREATDQLRHNRTVSIRIVAREVVEDCYVVTAGATLPNGRTDESIGAVLITGLKGEARANAMMKAETKAKRRVTLSICGLGMLDETEAATIPEAKTIAVDMETGEILSNKRGIDPDDDKLRGLENTEGQPLGSPGRERDAAPEQKSPSVAPAVAAPFVPPKTRTAILQELCAAAKLTLPDVLAKAGVPHADEMTGEDFTGACAMLRRRATKLALSQQMQP